MFSRGDMNAAFLNDRRFSYLHKTCTKLSPSKYCQIGVQRPPNSSGYIDIKNIREGVSQGPHLSLWTHRQLVVGNRKGVRSPRIYRYLMVAGEGVV